MTPPVSPDHADRYTEMESPDQLHHYHAEHIDWLRITQFSRLAAAGETYLDYTGAGLYPESLIMDHLWELRSGIYGNPHSYSPASQRSTELLTQTRATVLEFFSADPAVYDVVWTANATAAMQLVGLAFPYEHDSYFTYTADVHNSALGLREAARGYGAHLRYIPLRPGDLRINESSLLAALRCPGLSPRLFVYPAQSNFSGVQHPLSWITTAHHLGWRVLLDAAAFAPTNPLDLTRYPADYVAVSWYKIFGWPTGIGALIATHEALAALRPLWHAGGSTRAASVQADWYHLTPGAEGFEHGTPNYLAMPGVLRGCQFISGEDIGRIHERVQALTEWTLGALLHLTHDNGAPLITVYGPTTGTARGASIAFNFLDPDGQILDERITSTRAAEWKISLRTGCFCAPGASEIAFQLDTNALAAAGELDTAASFDDYLHILDMPNGGAIRISYGLASNAADALRLVEFATSFIHDQTAAASLPERTSC